MNNYDIVIPVSYKDCKFLKKNIPWIRKNLETSGYIYILTNKSCFSNFDDTFKNSFRVSLIDENTLIPGMTFSSIRKALDKCGRTDMTGWYFQQFLKLGFALSQYATQNYLVWDADTIPLNPIEFWQEGKVLINPKKERHLPYFDTITKLLGIHEFATFSFISEHMMMETSIMKEMISKLGKEDEPWWKTILSNCDLTHRQAFSEFETYGNYCLNCHPGHFSTRTLLTLRCGGRLFGRQVTDKELSLLSMDFDTASFERGQYPPFPRSVISKFDRAIIEFKHRLSK